MQKSTTKTGKSIVRQVIKFGKDDVRTVRFVRGEKVVTVTGKDLPKLIIKAQQDGSFKATSSKNKKEFTGRTQEQAFKAVAKAVWAH